MNWKATLAVALVVALPAFAGLEEKRMQQDYTKTKIPEAVARVKEVCGADIKIEVDWGSFKEKAAFESFEYALTQSVGALEEVCKDDIGKEAVKKDVKKIAIKNVTDAKDVKTSFKGGTVNVHFNFKEGASGTTGWTEIQKVIEEAL
jgi:hypothetical protein